MKRTIALLGLLLAVSAGFTSISRAYPTTGFERLKMLAGTWTSRADNMSKGTLSIRVVSNGTAIEEISQSSEHDQMVTIYTADGNRVALTHYCSLGNQPRMETPEVTGTSNEFAFSFTGASNLAKPSDPHMHEMVLKIIDDDHFDETWTMKGGDEHRVTIHYTRTK